MGQKKDSLGIRRPTALFTFVQAMGVCAMVIVAAATGCCAWLLGGGFADAPAGQVWELVLIIGLVAGVGGCVLWMLAEFVCMCGRVRKETAFTAANVRALGRIVLAFTIGGVLFLPLGKPMMDWLLLGMRGVRSPVWWLLPPFVAWSAALLVRAIQVLMRRAVEMQTEQDLTV